MAFEPPQRLVRALGETQRDGGAGWLSTLSELVRQAVDLRGLTVERVQAPGGRSSLLLVVRLADQTPAALKLAPPWARPEAERAALSHWDGFGAVRLLDAEDAQRKGDTTVSDTNEVTGITDSTDTGPGVLLLERLHPEMSVRSLPEAKALLEAAGTLRRLWVEPPVGHSFETVAARTGRQAEAMLRDAGTDPEAAPLVAAALAAREELLAAPPEERLLHGTFQQSKILAGGRMPWLAVGPDPVVGERAFDLARLVRDRVEDLIATPSGASVTRRRVKRLAESLDLDQERLRGWTLFRAVESGVRARRVGRPQDAELLLEFATWL